ncbi:MAG: histidine kinase dimerization/phospho-acceptor domain-containing protein [Chitinophagales bacterium]|nr:histidine kinase dimerization/phospho-acceptor domain-containing protein [Chitinophagales bacterium]
MRIKTKIFLGLSFLFVIIFLLGGIGAYFINQLSLQSKEVTKDNYLSLKYVHELDKALDAMEDIALQNTLATLNANAKDTFLLYLQRQEANITEPGEKQATDGLRNKFEALNQVPHDSTRLALQYIGDIRLGLDAIYQLNDNAIIRKNNQTSQSAEHVVVAMSIIGTVCFLIVIVFLSFFPSFIADPITKFTESIQAISAKNFETRVHHDTKDEFGELASAFNFMAEKLDEYEHSNLAQILFEKKRIDTIINNMGDAIIGLDADRKILFANHAALQLTGLSQTDMVGKYAPDVAAVNDLVRHLIKDVMGDKEAESEIKPLKIVLNDKENFFMKDVLKISTTLTAEKEAIFIGYVIILKNITPFHELDLAKTNFIATVSHELKTPITSIKMSLQLLKDQRIGSINEEQEQLVQTIKEEADRLLKITSELLNLAQVETGNIQMSMQAVQPEEIVKYAYEALKFQAGQKHINIRLDMAEQLPTVQADLEKSAWVLVNFLSNAIRYSAENSEVELSAKSMGTEVAFSVQDHSTGIDAKYQDKIFDKFYKVPGSGQSGTGLGLAISKDFIIAQGGRIWLESEIGKGSKFSFTLPKDG